MRARVLLAAAATALAAAAAAAAAGGVQVRGVDTSAYPRLRVTVVTARPTDRPPAVAENGKRVEAIGAENLGRSANIALLIDRSRSMKGQSFANAIAAARTFLDAKPAQDSVSIIGFGSTAVQFSGFSTSPTDADTTLRTLDVDRRSGTALYDAVRLASASLAPRTGAHVILLVTDGKDVSSKATLEQAVEAAHRARVSVYPIGIESPQFTPDALQAIARRTGGAYHGAAKTNLVAVYSRLADELKRTWRIEYLTAARPGDTVSVTASAAGQGEASWTGKLIDVGTVSTGRSALPSSAFTTQGTIILGLLVALLVTAAVGMLFRKSRSEEMRRRIRPHIVADAKQKAKPKRDRTSALKALFQATEHVLGRTRQWSSLQRLLERGDMPLKTVEFAYIILGSGLVVGFFVSALSAGTLMTLASFVLGALAPVGYVWRRARKRLNAFDEQLPDILMSVAASLKAGHSFKQGIQTIVEEAQEPAKKEFKRVLAEAQLGRPLEDALSEMADRLGSKNFSFIVTAVNVQNQVGGSLAGLFDMVADTVRQRQSFARKIKALTAMGRASAYVLIALPVFLAALLSLMNHKYMAPLFTTSAGHKLILVGLVMMGIGSVILRRIVSFKG
ncbi:MAG TPA: type II secretion system F family protein [Gaiellaceae bacterium]|nr:type II secretion system F family protein [Gaiellaceae bacterium]